MKYFTFLLVVIFSASSVYSQWQIQSSGTSENLNDVAILNQTTAIIVGENGTILKTSDNGLNWVAKNSGGSFDFNAVSFRDDQNGIVVGNSTFNLTTDGGESWSVANFNKNGLTISFRYWAGYSDVIIGCEDGTIFVSSNGGSSWRDPILFPEGPIVAVGFNFDTYNYTKAYAATTYHTAVNFSFLSDEWNFFENPVNPVWDVLTGGEFYDGNQYLLGWNGYPGPTPLLLRRTDRDTTWESIYSIVPGPFIPDDIKGMNEVLFICGSDGRIYNSKDGGNNWTEQVTNITENLNAIDFVNDMTGYSVGNNGTILFTSNGGVSSVEQEQSPTEYYLFQNYPNPFNPSTNIEYRLNSRQLVQLKVFDILGNEVTTLVNEEQPAGSYKVEFNPSLINSKQSSGTYFYKLSTTGEEAHSVQTKKMIYLK